MKTDISKLTEDCTWQELTEGMQIYGAATALDFKTGEWASVKPMINEEKCVQCLLCVPVCPDSCISVTDGKRSALDYDHCKGCGICVKACHTGAITMKGVK